MAESPNLLESIVNWLRQGYADGVPPQDYVPLLEVLHRRLTDTEVDAIVKNLLESDDSPITVEDIERATQARVLESPSEADLVRVASRLEGHGAPVIGVNVLDLTHLETEFSAEPAAE